MNRHFIASLAFGFASIIALGPVSAQTAPAADAAPKKLELQKIDSKLGSGKEAVAGSTVTVHYSGWLFDPKSDKQHGMMFDSSAGDKPFTFLLGTGRVIKGWDQGVAGMKVGGKRTLIIPQELGYGARGAGGRIPPYANLIFDVELLDVK
ncbi:FKBP-type peptidyl-prolyl cis-trans isomerase [Undibacterium sp. Jales W-56]|uniref:FKBP-type peptidyl-prolyl cis-trans isomerase n=1 Tax=Undibacterium sp. Jales W-56 TaxID=2897325 RepID=UPI0021D318BB|nr:FKBP-type peptidyl-prolyl cis-trans isomerase [Undibacterium sp. Jales W-56]MCU6434332.1 FKBP-type peptidyl-prolyl cis-trans isomerase [Undibacterium sp. Jales W-56]